MSNLTWHKRSISREMRAQQKRQKPCLCWFTGLSGAGKSTLANALEVELYNRNHHTYLLDGDNVRHGINKDLAFTDRDRVENIRRIGEVSKLFVDAGIIVLSAFISPFRSDRNIVRALFKPGEFIEIHVATPLDVCEQRDPKGLYKKARRGEIRDFTGVDSPYEAPLTPELVIDTHALNLEASTATIMNFLETHGYVTKAIENEKLRMEN